jgi:hypothetical protein
LTSKGVFKAEMSMAALPLKLNESDGLVSGVTRILPVVGLIGARLGNFGSVRCLFLQNYWDLLFVDRTKSFDGRTE